MTNSPKAGKWLFPKNQHSVKLSWDDSSGEVASITLRFRIELFKLISTAKFLLTKRVVALLEKLKE